MFNGTLARSALPTAQIRSVMTILSTIPGAVPQPYSQLTRIERVLDYIHANLDQPLALAELAEQSCWSRWQLQRVFLHETGLTVAHYVRELKLSQAAEALLSGRQRVLDLALCYGFGSEVSFSRAFKQQFDCSPLAYRKRGLRLGLRTPGAGYPAATHACQAGTGADREPAGLYPARGEGADPRAVCRRPDFQQTVPAIWRALRTAGGLPPRQERVGWWMFLVPASCSPTGRAA